MNFIDFFIYTLKTLLAFGNFTLKIYYFFIN